jgi:hypothetical protein
MFVAHAISLPFRRRVRQMIPELAGRRSVFSPPIATDTRPRGVHHWQELGPITVVVVGTGFTVHCVRTAASQTSLTNQVGWLTAGRTFAIGLLVSGQEQQPLVARPDGFIADRIKRRQVPTPRFDDREREMRTRSPVVDVGELLDSVAVEHCSQRDVHRPAALWPGSERTRIIVVVVDVADLEGTQVVTTLDPEIPEERIQRRQGRLPGNERVYPVLVPVSATDPENDRLIVLF